MSGRNNYGTNNSLYMVLMADRKEATNLLAKNIVLSKWDNDLHVLPASSLLEGAERELQGTAVARQLDDGDFKAELASRFSQNVIGYNAKVTAQLGKSNAHNRAVKNWAVLVTVFQMLSTFIAEMDEDYLLPYWRDCIVETVQNLRQELASQIFLDILGQLLAGGQAVIDDDMRNPLEYPPGVTVVGYKDDNFVYLLPEIALKAVDHVQPLNFGANAIGKMLKEDGFLLPGPNNLSTQKRVRGGRVRFWHLRADSLLEPVETDPVGESN
jgi:hypothetical protein